MKGLLGERSGHSILDIDTQIVVIVVIVDIGNLKVGV